MIPILVLTILSLVQTPALAVKTPTPEPTPAAVKAQPLPELLRLKVENLQLQADVAGKVLAASEAYKAYQATMAELGKSMDTLLLTERKACRQVDQLTKTWTPITPCKVEK